MTVRQKRIEDDKNKKWAQVLYKQEKYTDKAYLSFDNTITDKTYGWNIDNYTELPTFYAYFNRGDSLRQYYFDKASTNILEPLGNFDYFYYYYMFKRMALNYISHYISGFTQIAIAEITALCMLNACIDTMVYYSLAPYRIYSLILNQTQDKINYTKERYIQKVKDEKDVNENLMLSMADGFTNTIYDKNTYSKLETEGSFIQEFRNAWNDFVDKCSEDLNTINTTGYYDADGNWHWTYKACWVRFTLHIQNTIITMSSKQRVYKGKQLIRGRYASNSWLNRFDLDETIHTISVDHELIRE